MDFEYILYNHFPKRHERNKSLLIVKSEPPRSSLHMSNRTILPYLFFQKSEMSALFWPDTNYEITLFKLI